MFNEKLYRSEKELKEKTLQKITDLLSVADSNFTNLSHDANFEKVFISYGAEQLIVNINGDSAMAIVEDVFKRIYRFED